MLIKRASDIRSSEITDRKLYLSRRQLIQTAAGTAAVAAIGVLGSDVLQAAQPAPQRFADNVRHHVVEQPLSLPRIVDRNDVGVVELGRYLDFPEESLGSQCGSELRPKNFDGQPTVMLQIMGEIDRGHAATPELALDRVLVAQGGSEPREVVSQGGFTG